VDLLDATTQDTIHMPIEAMTDISKIDEDAVSEIAPYCTKKLLALFNEYHNDPLVGQDLLDLFKLWCNYEKCLSILIGDFTPFIVEIVKGYHFSMKGNMKENVLLLDSSILQHVLDILCLMLKKTPETHHQYQRLLDVMPLLIDVGLDSDDTYLLLYATSCMRTFISIAYKHILQRGYQDRIILMA
jgi:hypothetical protein